MKFEIARLALSFALLTAGSAARAETDPAFESSRSAA